MSPSSGSSLPPSPRTTSTHNNKTQNALLSQQTEKTLKNTFFHNKLQKYSE
jgi:hypothetical protein